MRNRPTDIQKMRHCLAGIGRVSHSRYSGLFKINALNPLLGATWPFVYFLQGRFGRAVILTWAYWFVCPAIAAKHLWCEQPVKEVQFTSICYVHICVYSSSYGKFLWWIDRRSAASADSTHSDHNIFISINIAVSYSNLIYGHC